jgi:hypothetical protein
MGARIGLFGAFGRPTLDDRLARRVLAVQLAERLSEASLRTFTAGSRSAWWDGGEPLEPVDLLSPERLGDLIGGLDCVVVRVDPDMRVDGGSADGDGAGRWSVVRELIDALGAANTENRPTVWLAPHSAASEQLETMGARGMVAVMPDLGLLAPRVFPSALLNKRLRYLRLMNWYPPGDPVVVIQGDGATADAARSVAEVLEEAVEAIPDLAVVIAELGDEEGGTDLTTALTKSGRIEPYRLPSRLSLEDLTAAIAASTGFVGRSVAARAVALAFGRQTIVVPDMTSVDELDAMLESSDHLVRLGQGPGERVDAVRIALTETHPSSARLDKEMRSLDSCLADIAALAGDSANARVDRPAVASEDALTSRITELEARLAVLEPAYEARGQRLVAERLADADVAWELRTAKAQLEAMQVELRAQWKRSVDRLEAEHKAKEEAVRAQLEAEKSAHAEVHAELTRLRATRTFRYTAGARRIYSALRRRLT